MADEWADTKLDRLSFMFVDMQMGLKSLLARVASFMLFSGNILQKSSVDFLLFVYNSATCCAPPQRRRG